jgi:tRNA(fMet)-specific endonuclease VapC
MMDKRLRVLDTNILSLVQRENQVVIDRLRLLPPNQVATTIVTVEEQMRGWLAEIKRAKKLETLVLTYARFQANVFAFSEISILPFDYNAAKHFQKLQPLKIRIGTPDLRIAAIALSFGGVLVTANVRDFRQIPGLTIKDWTVPLT